MDEAPQASSQEQDAEGAWGGGIPVPGGVSPPHPTGGIFGIVWCVLFVIEPMVEEKFKLRVRSRDH